MFFFVLAIYGVYILVFTALFYLAGYRDLVVTGTFVIDMLTGGFSPNPVQFQQYLFFVPQILMILLMFLGAVNFAFNYHLLTGKIKKILSLEVSVFLAIILAASITLVFAANIGFLDSVFHVVSMASSTGVSYVDISAFNSNATAILITLMAVGGCAFSMSGGIKVSRLLRFGEAASQKLALTFTKATKKNRKKPGDSVDAFSAVASILLFVVLLVVFALLFSTIGVSFSEALFEVGSALSTTGASMGATTVAMPLAYKWLMIAAMTIGRVEFLTILIVLVPLSVKKLRKAAESKSF
jgi:trk system potassium uptake protein TrkH